MRPATIDGTRILAGHLDPSPSDVEVAPRCGPADPAEDPLGIGPGRLREIEEGLREERPSVETLCDAADVLLIEGRAHDAVAVLFWGTLIHRAGQASRAQEYRMSARLSNALQHAGHYLESAEGCEGRIDVEGAEVRFMGALMEITKRLRGRGEGLRRARADVMGTLEDPSRKRLHDAAHAHMAMLEHSAGDHGAAMDHLCQVDGRFELFNACIWMGRGDDALMLMHVALEQGDDSTLRQMWRSPLLKRLQQHPLFDAIATRCAAVGLRMGHHRLTVPDHMLYGHVLTREARDLSRTVRTNVLGLQAVLDQYGPRLHPSHIAESGQILLRGRDWRGAEDLLGSAIERAPQYPQAADLAALLCLARLQGGNAAGALKACSHLPMEGLNRYFQLLALDGLADTVSKMEKLLNEVRWALADPATLAQAEDRAFEEGMIRTVEVALLTRLDRPQEAGRVLADITDPVARLGALIHMGDCAGAAQILPTLEVSQAERVWLLPQIHALEGEPGWRTFLVGCGTFELDAGELRLSIPQPALQSSRPDEFVQIDENGDLTAYDAATGDPILAVHLHVAGQPRSSRGPT